MPVAIDDFVRIIEKAAPQSLALDWDNMGLLVRCDDKIRRVLIALDVTHAVIDEAIENNCDMILAHHPVIFEPIKSISCKDTQGSFLMRLIKEGISLYAAHTSYDIAKGGINDILCQKLGLTGIETVKIDEIDFLRTGYLTQACDKEKLVNHVKKAFGIKCLKISQINCGIIDKVAVVGGSGGDFIISAKKAGAKVLITGEAKHHHYIEAEAQGVLLIEAGHFNTERYFTQEIFLSLQSCLNDVQLPLDLRKAKFEKAPYEYK